MSWISKGFCLKILNGWETLTEPNVLGDIVSNEETEWLEQLRALKPEVRNALLQILDELEYIESAQVPVGEG
ncbi:hypothetical protein [Novosphingobium sp.]|uniref:hypothetical protein n=1 Tax=Novosphingobium sp. TaxID=1874826 RepID=UPI0038BBFEA5